MHAAPFFVLGGEQRKGAVSKWLKQVMRGSAIFRDILGQAKKECRKNGTHDTVFIGIPSRMSYKPTGKDDGILAWMLFGSSRKVMECR